MTTTHIEQVAQALLAARLHRSACDASTVTLTDAAEAFAVQDIVTLGLRPGQKGFARYWKTGAPGRDGLTPHAALPPEGVWASPGDARSWAFNLRLVEAEMAFRLARDVTSSTAATLGPDEAPGLIEAMAVSIELVDSRWQQGLSAPALLKLADLQSHGALVLGPWIPFVNRDWTSQACTVQVGSQPPASWRGSHAARNPVGLLPGWLRHAARDGRSVPAGTVVTTGTWCGMLPAAAGDRVVVRFRGIGEAAVQL